MNPARLALCPIEDLDCPQPAIINPTPVLTCPLARLTWLCCVVLWLPARWPDSFSQSSLSSPRHNRRSINVSPRPNCACLTTLSVIPPFLVRPPNPNPKLQIHTDAASFAARPRPVGRPPITTTPPSVSLLLS
ncbi:hypothetical protein QC764_0080080 [Podospora pseudoanserina]|uniref:Uncharacterized protein n=1 Tax=Podospora pseudoanserina TaxID=2609844 RepID=A0ABR0I5Y5_9PEZI|nr:hypothetical protein QC764_0080080 [Podospora pseudoanserina]